MLESSRPECAPAPELRGLRRLRAADAPGVLDAFLAHPDMARQGDVTDEASALAYVRRLVSPPNAAYVIAGEERIRVLVGITVDTANRLGWVFYWTHVADRGLGLATAATVAVANHALAPEGLGLERLELGYRVDNTASARVASAAGFVVEGRERAKFLVDGRRVDVVTCGRLRDDPWPTSAGEPRDACTTSPGA